MNPVPLYPFTLLPVYQDYVWGGSKIRDRYGRAPGTSRCAESWEVADRPEGESIVRTGPLARTSLRELMQDRRLELVGALKPEFDHFPLLVKILDAQQTLSIQVHPNDETAQRCGGEAKTEMWYVLDATNDACVYAGFQHATSPAAFQAAIDEDRLTEVLQTHPVKAGDAVFIPGGRIHAIGAGCLILEIQQNSNTTYRVHDWGRRDADGQPRPLHTDEAERVIDWQDTATPILRPEALGRTDTTREEMRILSCDYFYVGQIRVFASTKLGSAAGTFEILFCKSGNAIVQTESTAIELTPGTTCLIPACITAYQLIAQDTAVDVMRIMPGPFYMGSLR